MSALNDNLAAQLDQQFPPEFDEKWVSKLLTDTDTKQTPTEEEQKKKEATARELALLEAEIRKQRIIRKTQPVRNKENRSIKSKSSLSAIEKQKQSHEVKNKMTIKVTDKPRHKGILGRTFSRIAKR